MLFHAHEGVLVRVERCLGSRWLLVSSNGRLTESFYLHRWVMERICCRPTALAKRFAVVFALAVATFGNERGWGCAWWLKRVDDLAVILCCSYTI